MKILLAGGGTAGHINPAISIASYAKAADNNTQILFIGKRGNMEQTLVPKAGFDMEFIDIEGFKRSLTLKNIKVIAKTVRAISESKKIMRRFKPDVVICTGGYVSG
ncbi:MAG: glycosyltransferase, partial [Clostridia bacterium]|nr:glycosyltransferase [Clostridia bacterium]